MATKRQAPDERDPRQQPWKRRRPNDHSDRPNHGKNSFKKAHAVNELKNTVRSVRRLLERDSLPANVRVEKERELQTAQRDLERAAAAKQRSEIISKYHKIRFFERQKAERRLKKARRALEACGDGEEDDVGEKARLKKEVEEREVDVNYALYYPLEQHYVSLFPTRQKKGEELEEVEQEGGEKKKKLGNPEMWELVKQCMAEGTLADLREGRLTKKPADESEPVAGSRSISSKTKKTHPAEKERVQGNEGSEESDNESGGGFFE